MQRDEILINFENALNEKGLTPQMIFETILGLKNLRDATIDREEVKVCF